MTNKLLEGTGQVQSAPRETSTADLQRVCIKYDSVGYHGDVKLELFVIREEPFKLLIRLRQTPFAPHQHLHFTPFTQRGDAQVEHGRHGNRRIAVIP